MRDNVRKLKFLCTLIFISVCLSSCGTQILYPAILAGYEKKDEHFDEDGFQDYTDYCKYYYKSGDDESFEKSSLYIEIPDGKLSVIRAYFNNIKEWMDEEERSDEFDFDESCISEGDYFSFGSNTDVSQLKKDYNMFENYSLYFYDKESHTLYYIHNNN